MYSLSLYPKIIRPSRIPEHCVTLIHNIFTNDLDNNTIRGISDHLPVFTIYKEHYKKRQVEAKKTFQRLRTEDSIRAFRKDLEEQSWERVYSAIDVDEAYDSFLGTYMELYHKNCPWQEKPKKQKKNQQPWMTKGLKTACKKKKTSYRTFIIQQTKEAEQNGGAPRLRSGLAAPGKLRTPGRLTTTTVASRPPLNSPEACQPPGEDSGARKEVAAGSAVPPADGNGCIAGKRRPRCHHRARSASFKKELSLRPKAKKKKRKSDKSKRQRRRSPSCSLSPLRKKKKKKKKKSSKKRKRHRRSSKRPRHSSSSFKRKRKDERKHKKSSRTHSHRRRRQRRSALECSCCRSSAEDRRVVEKSAAGQTSGRAAAAHVGANRALEHKSVKTAAKYPSVLSTSCTLLSKLFEGTTSRQGGSPHDCDSGNDTSSPPSCKTGTDGKSTEHRRAASPAKLEFADKENSSDSGNSVTSYASLCKTCGDDGLRDHVTLGCRIDHVGSFQTSGCSQRPSESSGGRLRTRSRSRGRRKKKRRGRRRSWCSSRYSGHHSRSLSSARSSSRSLSYSPTLKRRDSTSDTSSRGSYSRYSVDRPRLRRRTSSFRKTDVKEKASRKRRRPKCYSPMRKRRRDSPSHLEARRITSARKRPIPYFRPSPSSCSSISSWSSLFSHSRIRSRSRSRSRSSLASCSWSSYRSFSRSSSWNSVFGTRGNGRSRSRF
ncbi:serine/arginine repetitive matrix protein 4 isoform X2 [Dunckerocampus dactyliophorus]|uniref:serine/arginine repetitive matrix protein 4 isoform X2 n=1 Tax=Dunckerocampus dactyliophorus TaxID=161453 RepID=UPI0024052F84|nr:serine/arginine repetitive matrix protein 4 isoform X2 [Dunckerocampus dactyliophorus]